MNYPMTPRTSVARPPSKRLMATLTLAVSHLDPDCLVDEWFRIGAALHSVTGGHEDGLDLFDAWSSQAKTRKKYPGRRRIEYQWERYGRGPGSIKLGTLKHYLREAGTSWPEVVSEIDEKFGHRFDE
jgi:hypothetical protein